MAEWGWITRRRKGKGERGKGKGETDAAASVWAPFANGARCVLPMHPGGERVPGHGVCENPDRVLRRSGNSVSDD
jgi:hypothetical protein